MQFASFSTKVNNEGIDAKINFIENFIEFKFDNVEVSTDGKSAEFNIVKGNYVYTSKLHGDNLTKEGIIALFFRI